MKILWKNNKVILISAVVSLLILTAVIAIYIIYPTPAAPPQYVEEEAYDMGVFAETSTVYDSANGEIIIGSSVNTANTPIAVLPVKTTTDPETIWTDDIYAYTGNHTLVEQVEQNDSSIGVLSIPKIKLNVKVYDCADDMEAMSKGVAHFSSSSAFDGNVCLSAHNVNFDGSKGYFYNLHKLAADDTIRYTTSIGERTYVVSSITTISETDWSLLNHTDDNRLTLITCIYGQSDKRLCVQAIEQKSVAS